MSPELEKVIDARQDFIAVYKPIAGWKCVLMSYDDEMGCHTPWQTGFSGWANQEDAAKEGRVWAWAEEIPFFNEVIM